LAVTVFAGNDIISKDEESIEIWKSLGIKEERICPTENDNFWKVGEKGPCGPDTEIFYFRGNGEIPQKFDPEDERWVEIWNDVFMSYNLKEDNSLEELPEKNIDTGMGVERVVASLEGYDDNYMSSLWESSRKKLEEIARDTYDNNKKSFRIILDHIRASVFILADPAGIKPSNTDQGYILRRLIRRAIRHAKKLNIDNNSSWIEELAIIFIDEFKYYYKEFEENKEVVLEGLKSERIKFNRTLEKGLKEFEKVSDKDIDGKTAFHLFDTFGFPLELTIELAKEKELNVDIEGYNQEFKKHQELSRSSSQGKFKGGLAGDTEIETKYHTATHLLNAALKEVVDKNIHQRGSNITVERMRFDFNCDHKLTDEEKKNIEDLVNKWIEEGIDIRVDKMTKQEAIESGAECMFIEKYPDIVTVYSIGDISKELCGGPHVKNTKEIGKFIIKKEEASSSGVRRIKAILQ